MMQLALGQERERRGASSLHLGKVPPHESECEGASSVEAVQMLCELSIMGLSCAKIIRAIRAKD